MRTTILAYVIAILGFIMICGGAHSFFDLWNERAVLWHYATTIGTVSYTHLTLPTTERV